MSRQREVPELVYLLEAGASRAHVIDYTQKILDWAVMAVASTPRQLAGERIANSERHSLERATARLVAGKQELHDLLGLGYNPLPTEKP
jgi:hypothetical protein